MAACPCDIDRLLYLGRACKQVTSPACARRQSCLSALSNALKFQIASIPFSSPAKIIRAPGSYSMQEKYRPSLMGGRREPVSLLNPSAKANAIQPNPITYNVNQSK